MTDTTGVPDASCGPTTASIPIPIPAAARASLGDALSVFPVALSGHVFGWSAHRDASFGVLDAYAAGGGNFINAAGASAPQVPERAESESERVIGAWLRARNIRDAMVIATGASADEQHRGLRPDTIRSAVQASLQRLEVERIDLYYARFDGPEIPVAEAVDALSGLVDEGLIGAIGLSGDSPGRLREWLECTDRAGRHRPVALQPHYSLMEREAEKELLPIAREAGVGIVPSCGPAQDFLTGRDRQEADPGDGQPPASATRDMHERGGKVLRALDGISGRLKVEPGAVALAWLLARPGVVAPIASAHTAAQLPLLLDAARIALDPSEVEELERASA